MYTKTIRGLLFTAAIAFSAPSHSAVLLSDNFDDDSPITVLNYNSLLNWSVVGGTIDYIRSGSYNIACVGGTGGCIDLLGSTNTAGRLVSQQTFDLSPGVAYSLQAAVSGNQRNGPQNDFTIGFLDATTDNVFASSTTSIASSNSFDTKTFSLVTFSPLEVRLFFESAGTNNVGPILDNVSFFDNQVSVPEPGVLTMLGLGLVGLAVSRLRRNA